MQGGSKNIWIGTFSTYLPNINLHHMEDSAVALKECHKKHQILTLIYFVHYIYLAIFKWTQFFIHSKYVLQKKNSFLLHIHLTTAVFSYLLRTYLC